mmetsp:Transcript_18184/g.51774  ORF Transcript_18184/g.51774 Transcript_18184/m.51774 type:complete len:97 (+) Transcript_18184:492-782(+)
MSREMIGDFSASRGACVCALSAVLRPLLVLRECCVSRTSHIELSWLDVCLPAVVLSFCMWGLSDTCCLFVASSFVSEKEGRGDEESMIAMSVFSCS